MPRSSPVGVALSDVTVGQQNMIQSLRGRARSMCRLVENISVGCGSKISDVQVELDHLESVLESLRDVVYGSAKQSTAFSMASSSTAVVPTIAAKVAFPDVLTDFDPTSFLPEPF